MSQRWKSSSKPPLRSTDGRVSSAGKKINLESDARSASTHNNGGNSRRASRFDLHSDADSSSESEEENKLTVSASKLPPISRSNTSLSRSSSKNSSAGLHGRKPFAKQENLEIVQKDIHVSYQTSVSNVNVQSTVYSKNQTPETNKINKGMEKSFDTFPTGNEKKTKKVETKNGNATRSLKATKQLWGTRKRGKLVSKTVAKEMPNNSNAMKKEKSSAHIPIIPNDSQTNIDSDRQKSNESADSNESKGLSDSTSSRSRSSSSHSSASSSSSSESSYSSESSSSSSPMTTDVEGSELTSEKSPLENGPTAEESEPEAMHLTNNIDSKKLPKKKASKKLKVAKINPLTRLNVSQYDLLSSTAGAFHGPGDVYYKFVFGGKSVRPEAKKLKKVKIREVDMGKLDEILVEKSRIHGTIWNYKSVTKLREKHKEYLNSSISGKVVSLEQTRAYIITTINAINSFKKLLEELTDKNEELEKEYTKVIAISNKKVSETLSKNEDFVEKILKLEKEKIMERKKAVIEFANYMKKCEQHTSDLQMQLNQKENALKAKIHDMQDLKEFERASFEDPAITEKRLAREVESKRLRMIALEEELENTKRKFPALQLEFEQKLKEQGSLIFEKSLLKFDSYVQSVTQSLIDTNFRYKKGIDEQETLRATLNKEIEFLHSKVIAMKKEAARQVDERRNVLKLKDFMTCKPDMDIE